MYSKNLLVFIVFLTASFAAISGFGFQENPDSSAEKTSGGGGGGHYTGPDDRVPPNTNGGCNFEGCNPTMGINQCPTSFDGATGGTPLTNRCGACLYTGIPCAFCFSGGQCEKGRSVDNWQFTIGTMKSIIKGVEVDHLPLLDSNRNIEICLWDNSGVSRVDVFETQFINDIGPLGNGKQCVSCASPAPLQSVPVRVVINSVELETRPFEKITRRIYCAEASVCLQFNYDCMKAALEYYANAGPLDETRWLLDVSFIHCDSGCGSPP